MKRFMVLLLLFTIPSAQADPLNVAEQLEAQFVEVSRRVGPAVVSIATEVTERMRIRRGASSLGPFSGFEEDFFDRFFEDFFGSQPEREFKKRGLGTGVIIDADGYILTNEHVVHGADKMTVHLPDGREFKGKLQGADLRSDLAVIKIEAKNLPMVQLGDSDRVKSGQWAIAVGNPFGWAVGSAEPTVTVGVVSALGRSIQVGRADRDYTELIQTDAAINPGNSGGPLVNLAGEVIGINVAIFSTTGGYQGVGFAIPSNRAKAVLGDLILGKKVLYGWLGINVQDVTEELAQHFGLESKEGVIVAKVLPDSPGDQGGLKDGDVIRVYDGQPVKEVRDLLKRISQTPVGKRVTLGVLRDNRPVKVTVEIGERPGESELEDKAGETWRGMTVGPLTPELAERLGLPEKAGVVIRGVEPGSAAEEAGLREGDLIFGINRLLIDSVADFQKVTRAVQGEALLKTSRGYVILPDKRPEKEE